jgi:hypothetical protein
MESGSKLQRRAESARLTASTACPWAVQLTSVHVAVAALAAAGKAAAVKSQLVVQAALQTLRVWHDLMMTSQTCKHGSAEPQSTPPARQHDHC